MESLRISEIDSGRPGMKCMMIDGFTDAELKEFKKMDNSAAGEKLLRVIDERNYNIATCWHNGNGIYGIWFDNECAYVNIGDSCD